MKKIAILLALALASFSLAADKIQPTRSGPVSYYGSLQASGGQLLGSNTGNTPVQVKGMSLYWDFWTGGYPFYTESVVNALVDKWKIEIIRVAHGTSKGDADSFNGFNWQGYDDAVIEAAIKNDIYVIIDFHSHYAHQEQSDAVTFFTHMASKWGSYPNVIFEIFNEPMGSGEVSWNDVKTYANAIIPVIRNNGGANNLIVVGNTEWSAHPEDAVNGGTVTDAGNNTAYTFHFYANTHALNYYRQGINTAMQNGLTVFATEWGVGEALGQDVYNTDDAASWMTYLDDKKISWCNWSVTNIGGANLQEHREASAAFQGQSTYTNPSNWDYSGYSVSGKFVYDRLLAHAESAPWRSTSTSSSSAASSNSLAEGFTEFIDDFEDVDNIAYTGGVWYAYTDKGSEGDENGNGASTITNAEEDDGYVVVVSGTNSTEGMAALTGIVLNQGTYAYAPYVTLGMNLTADEDIYDLSGCSKFTYDYKGAAHTFKAQTPDVTNYNYHSTSFIASAAWKTAEVNWSDLAQDNWGPTSPKVDLDPARIDKFAWEVKAAEDDNGNFVQPTYNYLYVDNFRCVDGSIEIVQPSESSSSSKPKSSSSSHVNPTCEDGEEITTGGAHLICVNGEWTAVPASSASTSTDVVLIDDLSDANTGVEVFGDDGYWFLYEAGGSVTNTQETDGSWDLVRGNSTNYYAAMQGITGITYNDDTYPSVGMALHVSASGLGGCSAIQYDYKGSGHMFRAAMNSVTPEAGYEHVTTAKDKATGWTTVTVQASALKQPTWVKNASPSDVVDFSWDDVYQIVWVVDEKIANDQRTTELDVDNVKCVGTLAVATSSSSGTVQQSSSSAAACVEGQEIIAGGSHVKCVGGKWVDLSTGSSSSGNSSASTNPGIALIDDFQDENTQSETLGEAYWYIYTDKGSVTNTPGSSTKPWDMVRTEGTNAYVAMEGISGITYGASTYPSVGMGVDIPTSAFANCTAITYEYRGSAHKFRASLSTVTADKGYEHVTGIQPKATAWTPVTIIAGDLKQPTWIPAAEKKTFSWSQVVKLAWVVDHEIPNADRGTNLDIDNVQCVGALPEPKSSSSGSTIKSSSSGVISIAASQVAPGLSVSLQDNTLVVNVANAGLVKVQVFDMMGHVMERHSESMFAGSFAHTFKTLPRGMYVVRVQQGSAAKTLRMQVR